MVLFNYHTKIVMEIFRLLLKYLVILSDKMLATMSNVGDTFSIYIEVSNYMSYCQKELSDTCCLTQDDGVFTYYPVLMCTEYFNTAQGW